MKCRPLRLFFKFSPKIKAMRTLILTLISGFTLFLACKNTAQNQAQTVTTGGATLPPGTITAIVEISKMNCWVEQGQFLVTGICDNRQGEWQKIWLQMAPLDAEGRPLKVNGDSISVFPTFSDAVPPLGRTSFFISWPLSAFSGTPASCTVKGAAALPLSSGPILVISEQSGVKVLMPEKPGDTVSVEKAWQVYAVVENPLDVQAYHPRVEMLIYGTDQKLWFATVLNPEDPQQKKYVSTDKEGPMEPKEKRTIGAVVYYDNLPQVLKDQKIGRIEYQAFEARQ